MVRNTGTAIAPEHLPRLFDRFYRADKSRAHAESDGAGLGLAITRAIVEAHGGKVAVQSADGKTVFALEFRRIA
jgi:two-component system heavy metal sensor histidine kinase CusS